MRSFLQSRHPSQKSGNKPVVGLEVKRKQNKTNKQIKANKQKTHRGAGGNTDLEEKPQRNLASQVAHTRSQPAHKNCCLSTKSAPLWLRQLPKRISSHGYVEGYFHCCSQEVSDAPRSHCQQDGDPGAGWELPRGSATEEKQERERRDRAEQDRISYHTAASCPLHFLPPHLLSWPCQSSYFVRLSHLCLCNWAQPST